ncbi:hypothetical protein BWQ96_04522 [Gracilariopsis chorda]|uniref:Uncharacterized protein n=1 Tax=Gracilariopsis chorda TaxID=448386 RepID=A0A2V3IUF3_9FLOR|nr:hypothetical protein BWQ96_04522 [Gracilariopsis chorda]|eukprot:PXF45754.1 hypothetical protein BWQ96_04522 [Gracilariopsis chorda]
MTAAAYSGLAVAAVVGSPIIVAAMLIGGPPYLAYRAVKARRTTALPRRHHSSFRLHRHGAVLHPPNAYVANRPILRPHELLANDHHLHSASYLSITDPVFDDLLNRRSHRPARQRKTKTEPLESNDTLIIEERVMGPSRSPSRHTSSTADLRNASDVVVVSHTSASADRAPALYAEHCRTSRPFILERRRGSSSTPLTMKRSSAA